MASIPRCSYALASASSAPTNLSHLRRALSLVPSRGSAPSLPILDFLLPSSISYPALRAANTSHRGYATTAATTPVTYSEARPRTRQYKSASNARYSNALSASQTASSWATASPSRQQPRHFSTTARRGMTQTLLNPQKDEDGNEMRLEITSRAAKRLAKVMEKDGNPRLALRIQVESGGCHGFQYVMSLVTLPDQLPSGSETAAAAAPPADADADAKAPVIREDDTIFTYAGEAEEGAAPAETADPLSAPKIILDTPSLELLKGSKVDFTMELIGSQFKIVDNPLASSSCGCGTSFDIKI
ncbi:[4Fe-4S] proteins maturation [Sporothrix bragantina]|uniref:[4Fe-4S] proteins maturation n=1 Tax=Sporothrix bragantina TaxID=671064 RepID=A0ABP0BJV7_9PEZI